MKLQKSWQIFRRKPMAMVGLIMLLIIVVVAVFAPVISPYDPYEKLSGVNVEDILAPPLGRSLVGDR